MTEKNNQAREPFPIDEAFEQLGDFLADRHPHDPDAGLARLHAALEADLPAGFSGEKREPRSRGRLGQLRKRQRVVTHVPAAGGDRCRCAICKRVKRQVFSGRLKAIGPPTLILLTLGGVIWGVATGGSLLPYAPVLAVLVWAAVASAQRLVMTRMLIRSARERPAIIRQLQPGTLIRENRNGELRIGDEPRKSPPEQPRAVSTPHPGPPPPPHSPWPVVTLVCLLTSVGLAFDFGLIIIGMSPAAATMITVVLVGLIVACVVPVRLSGTSVRHRILRALSVLFESRSK